MTYRRISCRLFDPKWLSVSAFDGHLHRRQIEVLNNDLADGILKRSHDEMLPTKLPVFTGTEVEYGFLT
jgi:hypothetical protein